MDIEQEIVIAEGCYLSAEERKTLAALRFDAQTGPVMFSNAVALIERLLLKLAEK